VPGREHRRDATSVLLRRPKGCRNGYRRSARHTSGSRGQGVRPRVAQGIAFAGVGTFGHDRKDDWLPTARRHGRGLRLPPDQKPAEPRPTRPLRCALASVSFWDTIASSRRYPLRESRYLMARCSRSEVQPSSSDRRNSPRSSVSSFRPCPMAALHAALVQHRAARRRRRRWCTSVTGHERIRPIPIRTRPKLEQAPPYEASALQGRGLASAGVRRSHAR
jgi:hypothetical protein